jgi:hypothetical protein
LPLTYSEKSVLNPKSIRTIASPKLYITNGSVYSRVVPIITNWFYGGSTNVG